jgi:L-ascorbate metabolism protein UlaG (beta-lactamase superfamily)
MRVAERIRTQSVPSDSVAIWWLGQNSYLIKGAGVCIMIDPFFSRPREPEHYLHSEAPVRADELQPDAVFCTHNHSDHTDPGFLLPLAEHSPATRFFGPAESAQAMVEVGAQLSIQVVLSKTPEVSDVGHYGYIVSIGGTKVYDTGDVMRGVTREPSLMEPLRRAAPHVALITTSPTEEEFPDFEEAAKLALAIGARVAVPAHYGCFAKRTFDPAPFASFFRDRPTRAEIIPYCGCYLYPASR